MTILAIGILVWGITLGIGLSLAGIASALPRYHGWLEQLREIWGWFIAVLFFATGAAVAIWFFFVWPISTLMGRQ